MNPFVTFIIPTIGRPSLQASILSMLAQVDPDWNAIVIGDNVEDEKFKGFKVDDSRITFFNLPVKTGHDNVGAQVRNIALEHIKASDKKPVWVANLDDDDTVDKNYVAWLRGEIVDLLQFRAQWENGIDIRPTDDEHRLLPHTVCNAFAFKFDFAEKHGLQYIDGSSEDWVTIQGFITAGGKTKVSEHVAYYVRH